MSIASGTAGSVVWAGTLVAHTTSWELNVAGETPETTPQGVSWKEYIAGLRGYTFAVEFDFEMTGQQVAIQNAILNGTEGSARFYVNATNYYNAGTLLTTKLKASTSNSDAARGGFDFTGSGAISYN